MSKSKFGRSTLGLRANVLIGKAIEYTTQADFKAFVVNAVEGEMGVFENTVAQLLVPGNAAVAATKEIFIALKRSPTTEDGAIEKSQPFKTPDFKINYTAYSAPVKQVTTLVLGEGTLASAIIQDITYASKAGGILSNDISITYVLPAPSTALSVAVVGKAITVTLATNGGGAATSTATLIKAAIEAAAPAAALVTATITGTAATVQAAQATTNLQGGVSSVTMVKGTRFALTIWDLTGRYQPMPSYLYEVSANAGESFDGAMVRLTALINSATQGPNVNRDRIITAAYTTGTNTLVLTAIDFGVSFKAVAPYGSAFADTMTSTQTNMLPGSGTPDQIAKFWIQDKLNDGVFTNYPDQGQTPEDWGTPTSYIGGSETYDIFNFMGYNSEHSKTPHSRQFLQANFEVITPLSGSNPTAELKAIFGF